MCHQCCKSTLQINLHTNLETYYGAIINNDSLIDLKDIQKEQWDLVLALGLLSGNINQSITISE